MKSFLHIDGKITTDNDAFNGVNNICMVSRLTTFIESS